jgi:hypothetical protein
LLQQVLGHVPPGHWAQRFSAAPRSLVEAAIGTPDEHPLLIGWSQAASIHVSAAWLGPLWEWWSQPNRANMTAHQHLHEALLAKMPQKDAEDRLILLIANNHENWAQLIAALPRPWSEDFTQAYITRLLRYVADLAPETVAYDRNWPASFSAAAQGMPTTALAVLPSDLTLPETQIPSWQFEHWHRSWRELHEVTTLRLRIAGA